MVLEFVVATKQLLFRWATHLGAVEHLTLQQARAKTSALTRPTPREDIGPVRCHKT
jgi:hypothetical protein